MQMSKSKWFLPLFAVGLGFAMLAAMWIGGDPSSGPFSLVVMVAFGALILFGGRSETIRGLRGDGRDERFRQIDVAATAIAGLVVIGDHRRVLGRGRARARRQSICVARCDWRYRVSRSDRGVAVSRLGIA